MTLAYTDKCLRLCAIELMRLLGKTRFLRPHERAPRDQRDIQALVSALRRVPIEKHI